MGFEVNCYNVSGKIKNVKLLVSEYKNILPATLQSGDYRDAWELKQRIEVLVDELESALNPGAVFLEQLKQPETWEKLKVIADENDKKFEYIGSGAYPLIRSRMTFDRISEIFGRNANGLRLSQKQYDKFINNYVRDEDLTNRINNLVQGEIEINKQEVWYMFSALHSVFLNKYLEEKQQINIGEEACKAYSWYFLCHLQKGEISASEVKDYVGYQNDGAKLKFAKTGSGLGELMNSGEIEAEEAGATPGLTMRGGRLRMTKCKNAAGLSGAGGTLEVEQAGTSFALGMGMAEGATVYCKEAEEDAFRDFAGTAYYEGDISNISAKRKLEKSTILLKNPFSLYNSEEADIFWYDSEETKYKNRLGFVDAMSDYRDMDLFLEGGQGMVVLDESYDFMADSPRESIYRKVGNMTAGILVMKVAPQSEIGKGMRGGILILEDPDISLEDVKLRLSEDRPGGLVFMRVPDEDNEGETKLVKVG